MLDDDAGGALVELLDAFQSGISIGDIVIGKFFTLQLARGSNGRFPFRRVGVEHGVLMRILAVAQLLRLDEI